MWYCEVKFVVLRGAFWHCVEIRVIVWYFVVLCEGAWIVGCCVVLSCMVWYCLIFCGTIW